LPRDGIQPRTFFLNESHELSPAEKGGGGRIPDYVGISWASKGQRISKSLSQAMKLVQASNDPLKDDRFFVIAQPVAEVEKRSKDKKKAPHGTFKEPVKFGANQGRVFDRLGLDLLQVTNDGRAVVHGDRERMEQLYARTATLDTLGVREQARWVSIDSFEAIPIQLRVDADWLKGLKSTQPSDVVIELQPVLSRVEADRVLRAIADLLAQQDGEKLTGTGTDFSGRYWFRGKANQKSVRTIAKDFFSVQAIHAPLYSIAAAKGKGGQQRTAIDVETASVLADPKGLPCVAVVDLGVPTDHKQLAQYRRGQFVPQDAPKPPVGDHGAFVASRVVFGECASDHELSGCVGRCSFYDAMVGDYPDGSGRTNRVNDKIVMDAIRGVRGAAPDVRVFNLSFGDARPLDVFPDVERREKRLMLQDLDNFIFATDAIVIVAAGNSPPGVVPNPAYPEHHRDGQWALGPWACGFNTLVCGAYVSKVSANGLVTNVGWPSPFSRVGPGVCSAPVPSFCAEGGNTDDTFKFRPGVGVWGFSGSGLTEDRIGTSYAAPLVAREAALVIAKLQEYCSAGTQPFGVTVRAFLALTARKTTSDAAVAELAERTLGHGKASCTRIISPTAGSAVILWQGFIESPKDTVRVQLPIPLDWLAKAGHPVLRLVIAADPPVNEAAQATWSCRKIKAVLHLGPEATYLRAPAGAHETYPLIFREYSLSKYAPGNEKEAEGDLWLMELSYDEVFAYPPGMDFDPRQRVAFAAELIDRSETAVDPQPAMQALPIAASMNRLSIQPVAVRNPVIIRSRL
jgi:hypothetical protein